MAALTKADKSANETLPSPVTSQGFLIDSDTVGFATVTAKAVPDASVSTGFATGTLTGDVLMLDASVIAAVAIIPSGIVVVLNPTIMQVVDVPGLQVRNLDAASPAGIEIATEATPDGACTSN
jgi:hypothetical protein